MSSGFVSENELAERRRIRQEEWEKVRQPNQPIEAPEEAYDHRSLYERLEEQKQKKQLEYEEAHKLKNMVKGLDDDEIEFLDLVDRKKLEAEQLKEWEEKQEILDFRKKVEKLKEAALNQRIQSEIQTTKVNLSSSSIKSQHQLMRGVLVKRKAGDDCNKSNDKDSNELSKDQNETLKKKKKKNNEKFPEIEQSEENKSSSASIAVLPGLGSYGDSSDESEHDVA